MYFAVWNLKFYVLSHSAVLTFCHPVDYNPPGSSVRGIFQVRILEWVALSYPRGSSQPRDWTCVSCTGHSSILAWRIPWTEELGGLQSMGSQSVRHNRVSNALALAGRFLTTEPAWEAPNWIQSLTGLGLCFLCPFCTNALLFLPWPTHTHLCQHSDQYPTPLEPSLTFRPYHPHSHSHCQPGIKTPILHPHTELHHSS